MDDVNDETADCLFCKFVSGDVETDIVLETDLSLAFRDIAPQAPTHVLVVPKAHHATLGDLASSDAEALTDLMRAVADVAEAEALTGGHRVVVNTGPDALQSVDHVHAHVIGGRTLTWPPG
jgi:histidine triad (HIT) family protein